MLKPLKFLSIAIIAILLSFQSFGQGKSILIGDITNKIQIGNLAGSRPLTFGFKNMLEEYLQENRKQQILTEFRGCFSHTENINFNL
jgi:hypothetical protein